MLKKFTAVISALADTYSEKGIGSASAALSYYLTMTVFPLVICLYAMLGSNYEKALQVLDFAENFLAEDTLEFLREFLRHVVSNNNGAMFAAGLAVLISSASSAVRSMQQTIGEMQGSQRYHGLFGFIFSIILSFLFLAAIYFAILVMMTGQSFIAWLEKHLLPFDIGSLWNRLRFPLMAGIVLLITWGIYAVSRPKHDKYSTLSGALFAAVGSVLMSFAFSVFIAESAKYPLVYGSLASVILLMLWLYIYCIIIYLGAAVNILIRDRKRGRNSQIKILWHKR